MLHSDICACPTRSRSNAADSFGLPSVSRYKRFVHAASLWSWVLQRQLRNPIVGSAWVLLLVGCPLLWSLRLLPTSEGLRELAAPWFLPAGLLGASLGLVTLSSGQPFLSRLAPGVRWAGEVGALGLSASYMQLPILAGMLLCGAAPSDLGSSLPAILTCDLHLAGLAQLLLLPALSTATRLTLFLAGVWIVPALAAPYGFLGRALAPLDAARALRALELPELLPALLLALSLALVGFLLRTPSPRPGSA